MNTNNFRRLDRQEFAPSLQKGLGRAFLYVKQFGLDDVADLFLQACLHHQAWDPQSEGSRAKWLFSMLQKTRHYEEFSNNILNALKTETETWDLQQLFELSKEIALNGNEYARNLIRERALKIAKKASSDDWLGAQEWMDISGSEGMLELVRIYGQRLLADPKDGVPAEEVFPGSTIGRKYRIILAKHSQFEPDIKAYYEHIKKGGSLNRRSSNLAIVNTKVTKQEAAKRRCEFIRKEYSLSRIINDAKNKIGNFPGHYTSFGRCATRKELEVIHSAFLKEDDDDVRLRLLWVFSRTQIPFIDDSLFDLANGNNEKLRGASLSALAQISDARVHELAIYKVKTKQLLGPDVDALDMFINNYVTEDANLITQTLLLMKPSNEDAHSLVWSIIDIAKQNNDVALVDILKWGYWITPCANCRYRVIVQLDAMNHLDNEMLSECQYDAYEDIRDLAKKKLGYTA